MEPLRIIEVYLKERNTNAIIPKVIENLTNDNLRFGGIIEDKDNPKLLFYGDMASVLVATDQAHNLGLSSYVLPLNRRG